MIDAFTIHQLYEGALWQGIQLLVCPLLGIIELKQVHEPGDICDTIICEHPITFGVRAAFLLDLFLESVSS